MSETRKNHLNIDGAQVKEDDRVDSYKPIPDQGFRSSKASFGKSKEAVDPAEEKLLSKEDEAKIVTRVDMPAEAKYVVGDHRNGDAKIELDANKRQFSGLTKEELLKYADDPFWVRLRWFMFALFWALWVAMLAGAIAIIIRAPKCAPPTPKTWYEIGPLVDHYSETAADYSALEAGLPLLEEAKVPGMFINPCADTYEVLDSTTCIDAFKEFLKKAKQRSIKVIVDLTANFVSTTHKWFELSVNRSEGFTDFFVWADPKGYDGETPIQPNNWVTLNDERAWTWNDQRRQFYLHQFGSEQADLNFHRAAVAERFDEVLAKWLAAGADGVRIRKVRQLLVNVSALSTDEPPEPSARGAAVGQYGFLRHTLTADQPQLDGLVARWSHMVAESGEEKVFTLYEDGSLQPEWYRLRNSTLLRPASAAPLALPADMGPLGLQLHSYCQNWTALQLTSTDEAVSAELVALTTLLPVTPLLTPAQLVEPSHNETAAVSALSHLFALRNDPSIKFGARVISTVHAVNSTAQLIAVTRWKAGGIAYVAVFNPSAGAERANLTALPSLPPGLAVAHVSHQVRAATNYTTTTTVQRDDVLVPGRSSVVLSYVPNTALEQ